MPRHPVSCAFHRHRSAAVFGLSVSWLVGSLVHFSASSSLPFRCFFFSFALHDFFKFLLLASLYATKPSPLSDRSLCCGVTANGLPLRSSSLRSAAEHCCQFCFCVYRHRHAIQSHASDSILSRSTLTAFLLVRPPGASAQPGRNGRLERCNVDVADCRRDACDSNSWLRRLKLLILIALIEIFSTRLGD